MALGRIGNLAHRDPDQQLPELVAAPQRVLGLELPEAEALEHALQDVVFALAAAEAGVEPPAHEGAEACRKAFPDLPRGLVARARVGVAEFSRPAGHGTGRIHRSPPLVSQRTR